MNDEEAAQRAEFGAMVAQLRRARGATQERLGRELAERAHRDLGRRDVLPPARQTLRRWEHGLCWPDDLNGYLLCREFGKDPEELCLHRVVTPEVMARYERRRNELGRATTGSAPADIPSAPEDIDWERVSFVLRAMGQVDPLTVEDQWTLTRRYLDDRRRMRNRSLLTSMVDHIVRLRHLRARAGEDRLYRELTIMLCETLVGAGCNWIGLTDFGMAASAYREAATLSGELGEGWLRTTALMSLAQLSGIHAIAPWSPATRLALLEETRGGAAGASAQVRVWYQATRAQMLALLGQQTEAQRALELAARAQALVVPGTGFYFAQVDPTYVPVQQASVTLMSGRPREASALFRRLAETVDSADVPIRAWITVYVADAAAAAGDLEHAAPALVEARRLAQQIGCPLLEHSAERIATREPWAARLRSSTRRHQLDANVW
ncbi:MAG TPA: helix-turn-helix transcriptional regulator [Candidatus Dormibacteraeota bacterium]|nr:helix-turn-helix transcriptional regulator [Candidatus Dormibacteraeota bacterium]